MQLMCKAPELWAQAPNHSEGISSSEASLQHKKQEKKHFSSLPMFRQNPNQRAQQTTEKMLLITS